MAAAAAGVLRAAPAEPRTFVYKEAEGCRIKADVFGIASGGRKPAAVWIHGGALIMGANSRGVSPRERAAFSTF